MFHGKEFHIWLCANYFIHLKLRSKIYDLLALRGPLRHKKCFKIPDTALALGLAFSLLPGHHPILNGLKSHTEKTAFIIIYVCVGLIYVI